MIGTQNMITESNMNKQELTTLKQIKKDYQNGKYNELRIHIMYYLGHVPHYCGHEGLVKRLLKNSRHTKNYKNIVYYIQQDIIFTNMMTIL